MLRGRVLRGRGTARGGSPRRGAGPCAAPLRQAVDVVEPLVGADGGVDRLPQLGRGRRQGEPEPERPGGRGGDRHRQRTVLRVRRPDHQRAGPPEPVQRRLPESRTAVQRPGRDPHGTQQLAVTQVLHPGTEDEVRDGQPAGGAVLALEQHLAVEGGGQGDHRAGGEAVAEVAPDGGHVPDLEAGEEGPAALLDQRGGRRRQRAAEAGQLGDGAGRRDVQGAVRLPGQRGPAHPGEVDQPAQMRLRLGEEVRAAAEPGVTRPPGLPAACVAHVEHRVEIHFVPPASPRGFSVSEAT